MTRAEPVPVVFPRLTGHGADGGDRARTDGFTRGHAAGYAAGLRSAEVAARIQREHQDAVHRAEAASARERLASSAAGLEAAARALRARSEPVLAAWDTAFVDAVVELAETLLGDHAGRDPFSAARAALTRALSAEDADDVVRVRLNPTDLALLQDTALDDELGEGPLADARAGTVTPAVVPAVVLPAAVTLVPDAALAPGDAVADYPVGTLDARIGTAVARVRAALAAGPASTVAGNGHGAGEPG